MEAMACGVVPVCLAESMVNKGGPLSFPVVVSLESSFLHPKKVRETNRMVNIRFILNFRFIQAKVSLFRRFPY